MGRGRTLKAVAEVVYGPGVKHGLRTVEKWSSEFDWVARVQAMEARDEMMRREAIEEAERRHATEKAQKLEGLEHGAIEVAEKMIPKLKQMADWPIAEKTINQEDADGNEKVVTFKPARWSMRTVLDGITAINTLTERPAEDQGTTEELERLLEAIGE